MDDDVAESLQRLEAYAVRIDQRLERIERKLERTQQSCTNMDEHITFVENVYTAVRQPLSYLASKFRANPLPLQCSREHPEFRRASENEPGSDVRACEETRES